MMKDIQDAQICKNKIIDHIGKQYNKYNLSPIDNLCDTNKEDCTFGNLEVMCEYGLGDLCRKFLDAVIQKRAELRKPLNEKDIDTIIMDIIKHINVEDKEKIIKFQRYLDGINRNKSIVSTTE